jgi:hypothetical protein
MRIDREAMRGHGACTEAGTMRRAVLLAWLGSMAFACEAAGADDAGETDGPSSTSSASTTGITTTGPATGGSYDGDTEPPPPEISCEMCLFGWCGDELQVCLEDANCACFAGCGDGDACTQQCGTPGPVVIELFGCIQRWCVAACADDETTDTGTGSETGLETDTGEADETGAEGTTTGEMETEDGTTR